MLTHKAQISIEFSMIIGFLMITLMLFIIGIMKQYQDIRDDTQYVIVRDIAFKIRDEISIAYSVQPVYTRNFSLPQYIEGVDYDINITGNVVIVTSDEHEFSLSIASGSGCISWGNNTIKKLSNDSLIFECSN